MRRVRRAYLLDRLSRGPLAALLIFFAALWGIGREVWVARVIENFTSAFHSGTLALYIETAILNTRFIVLALVLLASAALLWLAYHGLRFAYEQGVRGAFAYGK